MVRSALLIAGCALLLTLAPQPAFAVLNITITKGVLNPIPIAIVPFAHTAGDDGFDVAAVVQSDLASSGRFKPMPRGQMPGDPTQASQVQAPDWKNAGEDYLVVGRVLPGAGGKLDVDCQLVNVLTGQTLGGQQFIADPTSLRSAAHRVSDYVYRQILGVRGAFDTRIAYVAIGGEPPHRTFRLVVADADGANAHTILESAEPLMSPAWSPNGKWLAYVSFENRLSAVYVQRVRTGQRVLVSERAGVNGAPAWSPDGKELALTLSGSEGSPNLWLLNLGTQKLTRLTDDPSIDTEAAWSPDGKYIYFTSDRAGGPQIFRLEVKDPSHVERLTFGSAYDARPRVSPDGKTLVFLREVGGDYRIAVQDLSTGAVTILTHGSLDQSPSIAPNGATIIYTGRNGPVDTLETVSVDGLVTQRLRATEGSVREPAWGPFTQ